MGATLTKYFSPSVGIFWHNFNKIFESFCCNIFGTTLAKHLSCLVGIYFEYLRIGALCLHEGPLTVTTKTHLQIELSYAG